MSDNAPRPMTAHNNLHAVLFQATSAEYIALCHQAYQLARHALLGRLNQGTFRNPAVVFDLDETVLDNSAYQAWQIGAGANFDESSSWRDWCNAAQAEAVPGALEFIEFVREQGARPFFITSRENVTRAKTIENLRKLGVVTAEEADDESALIMHPANLPSKTHLFMKRMDLTKVTRPSGEKEYKLGNKFLQRVFIEQVRGYEVILSVGDNLGDYAEYYGMVPNENGEPSKVQK